MGHLETFQFYGLYPPLRKYVKKINSYKVKKENMFDPPAGGELFSFSGMNLFLVILSEAAACPAAQSDRHFLLTFFCCRKKASACPA